MALATCRCDDSKGCVGTRPVTGAVAVSGTSNVKLRGMSSVRICNLRKCVRMENVGMKLPLHVCAPSNILLRRRAYSNSGISLIMPHSKLCLMGTKGGAVGIVIGWIRGAGFLVSALCCKRSKKNGMLHLTLFKSLLVLFSMWGYSLLLSFR